MQNEEVTSSKFDILWGSKSIIHSQSLLATQEISLITHDALSSLTYEVNGKDLNFTFKARKIVWKMSEGFQDHFEAFSEE